MDPSNRMTIEAARAKAEECRELARQSRIYAHKVMLEHMADTWTRIADNMQTDSGTF